MTETDTAARARTRREIVGSALDTLAADPGASLAGIATAAQVSRTTVHRYFAERSDLLAAVADEAVGQVIAATERARLERGPVPDALARLCREYFELGSVLTVLFNATVVIPDEQWERHQTTPDGALATAIARGRDEGTIGADLTDGWIEQLLWALLYSAWSYARGQDIPRHEALDLCVRSLRKAIAV